MVTTNKLQDVSDMDVGDIKKLSRQEMIGATKKQLSKHIEAITQTTVCADNQYCKTLIDIWLKK